MFFVLLVSSRQHVAPFAIKNSVEVRYLEFVYPKSVLTILLVTEKHNCDGLMSAELSFGDAIELQSWFFYVKTVFLQASQ